MGFWKKNISRQLITLVAVLGCLALPLQEAAAQNAEYVDELNEEFGGGTWQDCLWRPYQRTGGSVEYFDWDGSEGNKIRVSGGRLEIQVDANERPGQSWDLGLESKFLLAGDFEAQVDYEISHTNYWANLDMRGVNMLFVELMAGDQGTRRRHIRSLDLGLETGGSPTVAHLWLSNTGHNQVTQIDTDNRQFLRRINVGVRPGRTAVDLLGNVYIHNRGSNNGNTSVTFIKASACPDPDCNLSNSPEHIYTLNFSGGDFGNFGWNGQWGGGLAVDRSNNVWVAFREHPENLYHLQYHPSDTPGGDTWTLVESYNLSALTNRAIRPYGMAIARDGSIWIASRGGNSGLVRFNPLTETAQYYAPPSLGCTSVYGMAIDADQRVHLATWSGGNCRGSRFDPSDNSWISIQAGPGHQTRSVQNVRGLATDNQGRVWLAGHGQSEVVSVDSDTGLSTMVQGACSAPAGVALDRNNLVWVSCMGGNNANRVRYFNLQGEALGTVPTVSTYTYSDMTGYQLRNFGLEDWEESFLVGQDEITGTYYRSSVENNYGGGIEFGAGSDVILDPTEAPFTMHPDLQSSTIGPFARRIRLGDRYHTDSVARIADHPLRLEGVWGFRTPSSPNVNLSEIPFRFTVTEESYVYVAFEAGASPVPQWLRANNGWTTTNEIIQTTDTSRNYRLYRRNFQAGQEVILQDTNAYSGAVPSGAPFENYFVYVFPRTLESQLPDNPQAYIDDSGEDVSRSGTLRIARQGSQWTYSWRDGGSSQWRSQVNPDGPLGNVPMRLRARLDPFWHGGPQSNPGAALLFRFDNFIVNEVEGIPGAPYCREGCDESVPGYGSTCRGGPLEECPGTFTCVEDQLTCVPEIRPERCNGLDDDCDGWVDHNADGSDFPAQMVEHNGQFQFVEDFGMPGSGPDTGADVFEGSMCATGLLGPCAQGYWECVSGAMQCQPFQSPQPEVCDGNDNSCDGTPNVDSREALTKLGRHIMASQRSAPANPVRPIVGTQAFSAWAGVSGGSVNPAIPELLAERRGRVVLYLDPTYSGPGAHDELGAYVLWLSHGANTGGQGKTEAFYEIKYGDPSYAPFGTPVAQTGIVKSQFVAALGAEQTQALKQLVSIQAPPGQSGGVALGPFPATQSWQVKLSSYFSGDVDRWELFNAVTGEMTTLSANETLQLSNNSNGDFFGPLTAEVGSSCSTGDSGICGFGASRCVQTAGEWGIDCMVSVVPQLEVCDGRDNSCSGEVDFNADYGFAVPMVEFAAQNGLNQPTFSNSQWEGIPTVDFDGSAFDFLNFQPRETYTSGTVGSPNIRDVMDPSRTIQEQNASVWTFHRDMRQGNGTLSLVMAHGKHVRQADGDAVPTGLAGAQVNFKHWDARESFVSWLNDLENQVDGTAVTAADSVHDLADTFDVWTSADIGTTIGGSATVQNNGYEVRGGGGDIQGGTDSFHFAYQQIPEDGEIRARVNITNNPGNNGWAKAGIMMRQSLDANSGNVFVLRSASNGNRFQRRGPAQTWTSSSEISNTEWLRLRRDGNDFHAYTSTDGVTWTHQSTQTLAGSTTIYAGFAVSSHEGGSLTTATFQDVAGFGGAYMPDGIPSNVAEGPGYFFNWQLHRWGQGGNVQREADAGIISDVFSERTDFAANTMVLSIDTSGILDSWRLYAPYHAGTSDGKITLKRNDNLAIRVRPGRTLNDPLGPPSCVIQDNVIDECLGEVDTYTCSNGGLMCGTGFGCCDLNDPDVGQPCDNPVNLDDYLDFIDPLNPEWRDSDGNIAWRNMGICRAELTCGADGSKVCRIVEGPSQEMCDGFDNTCDGMVDGIRMFEASAGVCSTTSQCQGTQQCVNGQCVFTCSADQDCAGIDGVCRNGTCHRGPTFAEGSPDVSSDNNCTNDPDICNAAEGYVCAPVVNRTNRYCVKVDYDICPEGQLECGPQECGYNFICACDERNILEGNDFCLCEDALSEYMSPYERLCEPYERLENGECVAVASMLSN